MGHQTLEALRQLARASRPLGRTGRKRVGEKLDRRWWQMWCSTSNVERFRLEVGSTPNDAVFVPEWAAGERLEQRRREAPEVERRIRPATAERLGRHVKWSPLKQALARGRAALEHRGSFY